MEQQFQTEEEKRAFAEQQAAAYERLGMKDIMPDTPDAVSLNAEDKLLYRIDQTEDPDGFIARSKESGDDSGELSEKDHIDSGRGGEWEVKGDGSMEKI